MRTLSHGGFNFLQLVFIACVAAVKCRPILLHCVVIFFWSSGAMACMLFIFENKSSTQGGDSGMASFITSDEQLQHNRGCYFPMHAKLRISSLRLVLIFGITLVFPPETGLPSYIRQHRSFTFVYTKNLPSNAGLCLGNTSEYEPVKKLNGILIAS